MTQYDPQPRIPSKREAAAYFAQQVTSKDILAVMIVAVSGSALTGPSYWLALLPVGFAIVPVYKAVRWLRVFGNGDLHGDDFELARRNVKRSLLLWLGIVVFLGSGVAAVRAIRTKATQQARPAERAHPGLIDPITAIARAR